MYKKIISTITLSLAIMCTSYAQDSKLFYDNIWRITTEANAEFYRACNLNTGYFSGEVKDYYKTGEIQMTGNYSNDKKEGEFKFYYKNGNIKKQGSFKNNVRTGIWYYYYSNGNVMQKLEFINNCEFKLLEYNDSSGKAITGLNNKIIWKNSYLNYFSEEYIRFGHFYIEGTFENNVKSGEWICKDENGKVLYKEKFSKGNFKKRTSKSDNFTFRHPGSFLKSPFNAKEEICNKLPIENKFYRTENFIYAPNVVIENFNPEMFLVSEIMPSELFTKETLKTVTNQIKQIISETHPEIKKLEIKYLIQKDGSITNISFESFNDKLISNKIRNIIAENIFWTPGYQRLKPVYILKTWIIEI